MKADTIHIGTSGWHYGHWKGPLYPENIPSNQYLSHYTANFSTVEINNTFYKMPQEKTLRDWKKTASGDFIFSVKASRYITHMKKLKDPHKPVANFLEKVSILEKSLGPILFQLPPNWGVNPDRLKSFLDTLPDGYRYAIEFRDPSWFDERVYNLLMERGAAFCIYDFDRRESPREITADFIYIRLHGSDGPYRGKYSVQALAGWAGALSAWVKDVSEIFVYFDNDESGFAPKDALLLKSMIEDR